MKKTLFLLPALYFLFAISFSPIIFAAAGDPAESPIKSIADILKVLNNVVKWIYIFFFVVAILFILFAAYQYLTSQGNPETIQKINKQIFYAVIAIVIAIVSVGFDVIIRKFLEQGQ